MNKNFELYFENPLNIGNLDNYNYCILLGSPLEGALIKLQILVNKQEVVDVKYKAYGALAIALMSWYTQAIKGKSFLDIKNLELQNLEKDFEITPIKMNNLFLLKQIHADWIKKIIDSNLNLKESYATNKRRKI